MMLKTTITIGLFDKDTERQEIKTEDAQNIIANTMINDFDIFAFTMWECAGVYKMNSTGNIIREPSIRVEIATDEAIPKFDEMLEALKKALNQETIMTERGMRNINFE